MKAETASVFTHVLPRRRTKDGEPVPGRLVAMPPLVTLDPDALLAFAEEWTQSPESARKRLPVLMAKSAIAAADNAKALRRDLCEKIDGDNERYERELALLRPDLRRLQREERALSARLSSTLAPLGVRYRSESPSLTVEEEDLPSLEDVAGRHGLPTPSGKMSVLYRWPYRAVSIVGGGSVIGIGLGMLLGQLEPYALSENPSALATFLYIGLVVMYLMHVALSSLSTSVGDALYRAERGSDRLRRVVLSMAVLALAVLAVAFLLVEAKVEQLGLFKAVVEGSSLTAVELSRYEAGIVSLMLALPAVASGVLVGLAEGFRRANLCHLSHLQGEVELRIRSDKRFASACALHQALRSVSTRREACEEKMKTLEGLVRTDLTREERYRLQDVEMDAVEHSRQFVSALAGAEPRTSKQAPWWMRWWRGPVQDRGTS